MSSEPNESTEVEVAPVSSTSSSSSISSSTLPVLRRLGSISGLRTVSGSISGLQGTGSFDELALTRDEFTDDHETDSGAIRGRPNTDNSVIHQYRGLSSVSSAMPSNNQQPPSISVSASDDSTSNNHNITLRTASNDSADEELKMAKAMALAVQKNPNLTPDEIRQLMASTQQSKILPQHQQQQQHHHAVPAAAPSAAATTHTKTSSMLIPGRLTNVFHLSSNEIESGAHNNMALPLQKSVKANFKNLQESFRASGQKARDRLMDIVGNKSSDDVTTPTSAGGGTKASTTNTTLLHTSRPLSPATSVDTASGKRSPFRGTGIKNIVRSPPLTTATDGGDGAGALASTTPSTVEGGTVIPDGVSDVPAVKTPPNFAGTSTLSGEDSIRLTAIVWKRRAGLGKYSVHSAWERRRIVLQGTKLSYFTTGNDSVHNTDMGSTTSLPPAYPREMDEIGDCANAPKRTNWFEQATATLVAGGSTFLGGDDHTTPRGYLDLVKDGASVAAATGHTGAPTPFAISIKVRGETKWKLCFDMHKTQMEWLAALTDVVVQGSVDAYNATLVDAMNPAHMDTPNFLQAPPTVFEPPPPQRGTGTSAANATSIGGGGHRLWMLENYTIRSQTHLEPSGDDYHDENKSDEDDSETGIDDRDDSKEEEHDVIVTTTVSSTEESKKVVTVEESAASASVITSSTVEDDTEELDDPSALKDIVTQSIPEKNLVVIASVLNASLAYSRASSTSMEGFWFVVVFANLALYLCTVQHVQKAKRAVSSKKNVKSEVAVVTSVAAAQPNATVVEARTETKRSTTTKTKSVTILPKEEVAVGGLKPKAGTTSVRIKNPTDVPMNSKNHIFAGFRGPPGETLMVRSHGYLTTKKKIPSPGELYKLVTIDIFESPQRYPDMAPRVQLPKVDFGDGDKPKTWHSPDIFVISFAIPTDPPRMTGGAENDGGGYTVTMYFSMHEDTREILRRITAEDYDPMQEPAVKDIQKSKVNAVRLFEEWCRRAPTDPKFQARFKLVPHAHNLKEIGMPSWISKYNGKPLLIKRPGQTGFLIPHPELSCIEFDISLHVFPYVAKKAICYVKEHFFRKVLVTFGFVIEGRADDELPECVLGLMQLCYPDPIHAIQAKDFFAGTCASSFD